MERFMQKLGILGLLVIPFATPARPATGDIVEFTAGGAQVIFKRVTANQVISAQLYFKGGVQDLTPETQGVENLLLAASLKGTKSFPKDLLNAELSRMGTEISPRVDADYSALSLKCVRPYWDRSWEIFADVIRNPTLDSREVEIVREQLATAAKQERDNPDAYVRIISSEQLFAGHPYALRPQGTPESLARITIEDLHATQARLLHPSRLLLVVVGDLDGADLERKVSAAFAGLAEDHFHYAPLPAAANAGAPGISIVARDLPTNYVAGLFQAVTLSNPDYPALLVGINILDDRLFEEVRTKRHLSYAVAAGLEPRRLGVGYFYTTAVDAGSVWKVMRHEVERIQKEPIPDKELRDQIAVFITRYYLRLSTNESIASMLAGYELVGNGWEQSQRFVEDLRKVTPADIQRVMKTSIKNVNFGILGKPETITKDLFTTL